VNAVAEHRQVLDVAVAVLQREDGRVLLAQRPAGKPWEGYWEFPGGKIESGEAVEQALARELHEELGVDPDRVYPWVTQEYAYPEKRVRLHFYRVLAWHGQPHGREGQSMSWENPSAVNIGPLLPANDRVLRALSLPSVYAITNAKKYGEAEFMLRLKAALEKGVRLIQVREHEMAPEQLESFARRVVELAHDHDARVLINGDEALARHCGADGVHLPGEQLMRMKQRPGTRIWAASCHDAAELAQAARFSADFVVLSPVLPTPTHPDATGMGWEKFAALVKNYPVPVYALGGMKPELLDTAMKHGAHGVSLLSGIW
jgi:8-oxo-dGTP diphosphatase